MCSISIATNPLLPADLLIEQSRNIHDYKPILQDLIDDFGWAKNNLLENQRVI